MVTRNAVILTVCLSFRINACQEPNWLSGKSMSILFEIALRSDDLKPKCKMISGY